MFSTLSNISIFKRVNLFPHNDTPLTHLGKKPFENIVGKGEIACTSNFSFSPLCFLLYQRQKLSFLLHLSSAIAFNLVWSKLLSCRNGLRVLIVLIHLPHGWPFVVTMWEGSFSFIAQAVTYCRVWHQASSISSHHWSLFPSKLSMLSMVARYSVCLAIVRFQVRFTEVVVNVGTVHCPMHTLWAISTFPTVFS